MVDFTILKFISDLQQQEGERLTWSTHTHTLRYTLITIAIISIILIALGLFYFYGQPSESLP